MRLVSMVLEGYIRLLPMIEYFELRPNSIYQIIIGTNGSGKSSILRETSPLPAAPNDYRKGGRKVTEWEHRGKIYLCTSTFDSVVKHSFQIDGGKNLNEGGTATVQKELVKRHLGYTLPIHMVMTGENTFTSMSTAERRAWVIDLSNIDLDLALGVYKDLSDSLRDTMGEIKRMNHRITSESDKLLNDEKLAEMQSIAQGLKDELTMMMEEREPNLPQFELLRREIGELLSEVETTCGQVLLIRLDRPYRLAGRDISTLQDVDTALHEVRHDQSVTASMLNNYKDEYQKVQSIVEALAKADVGSIDNLRQRRTELHDEVTNLSATLRYSTNMANSKAADASNNTVLELLETLILAIPGNQNRYFNREAITSKKEELEKLTLQKDKLARTLSNLQHRIEHIESAQASVCPKCDYQWVAGVSDNELNQLKLDSEKFQIHTTNVEVSIVATKEYLEAAANYQYQLQSFRKLKDSFPLLKPFWDYVLEKQYVTTTPKQILVEFQQWAKDCHKIATIHAHEQEIDELTRAISYSELLAEGKEGHYGEHVESLTHSIEEYTQRSIDYRLEFDAVRDYRKRLADVLDRSEKVKSLLLVIVEKRDLAIRSMKSTILSRTIQEHQVKLASLTDSILNATIAREIVQDISATKTQSERELEAYQALVDELSPKDGLIADQLTDFIRCMVDQMNLIIEAIWTYDMEIIPCGVGSGELDYKFPLIARNADKGASDVAGASTGQREAVNYAYKLITMLYLGMQDYPIMLDELAQGLDEKHRINIIRHVHDLMESHAFSQLFMVSHYLQMHGVFANAEVCVVDPSNILNMPERYNRHVVIR